MVELYVVVERDEMFEFERAVLEHIKEGFQLQGGMSTYVKQNKTYYCQALVYYKNEN